MISPPPIAGVAVEEDRRCSASFAAWHMQTYRICADVQNSGTTAQRPVSNLYEGKEYTDLTLSKKVWYINGAWRDNTGAPI